MTRLSVEALAEALGAARVGPGWMARCPAHRDSTPSLSISASEDGRSLIHCHAGCEQSAVIEALRSIGLWGTTAPVRAGSRSTARPSEQTSSDSHRRRTAVALKIWCAAEAGGSTLIAHYFVARSLRPDVPARLRFHPALDHRTGATWPAMIGLVTNGADDRPLGIHRTWLARDGRSKAPVSPNKMMLGPCRGGAVRLARAISPLMIGEGIETCLSAMQATGYATWAALSTSGLKALVLPPHIADVIVLADGDDPGERAAQQAADRWAREGRRVRIARPPVGQDFNDLLAGNLRRGDAK